jgi:quinol---cytochrome c reductase iron-sulfur subunit, bacillus type
LIPKDNERMAASRWVELGKPAPPADVAAAGTTATRRTTLGYMGAALVAFMATVAGLPMVGYLAAPLAARASAAWLSLGKADTFTPGEPRLVSVSVARQDGWRRYTEARAVWVSAEEDGQFTVLNGRCTHLGCAYSWRTEGRYAGKFYCPCHDGVYDRDGTVLSGPPPRALDRLDARVIGDDLMVLQQDFRLGVPSKEPV